MKPRHKKSKIQKKIKVFYYIYCKGKTKPFNKKVKYQKKIKVFYYIYCKGKQNAHLYGSKPFASITH